MWQCRGRDHTRLLPVAPRVRAAEGPPVKVPTMPKKKMEEQCSSPPFPITISNSFTRSQPRLFFWTFTQFILVLKKKLVKKLH